MIAPGGLGSFRHWSHAVDAGNTSARLLAPPAMFGPGVGAPFDSVTRRVWLAPDDVGASGGVMAINFGSVYLGWAREMRNWMWDLCRYKTIQFLGYSNGRVFIGVMWGSKDGNKDGPEWTLTRRYPQGEWSHLRDSGLLEDDPVEPGAADTARLGGDPTP